MPIRYFFKQLLLPPGGLLLLLLAAWWLRRRSPRLAAFCFMLGFGGLWLMSLPVTVEWAARAIESEVALHRSEWSSLGKRAQAIVVLGAGREQADPAWGSDQPSHIALERLRYASRLAIGDWRRRRVCQSWRVVGCTMASHRAKRSWRPRRWSAISIHQRRAAIQNNK